MKFTKMEGLGNDYIYLNCLEGMPPNLPQLAVEKSRRRRSVGADGIICICASQVADYGMVVYNADGSLAEMCGNGIRCVGKYLYDRGITAKTTLTIETGAGIRTLWLRLGSDGMVTGVKVDMGQAVVSPPTTLAVGGFRLKGVAVSVGNPHFVILWDDLEHAPVEQLGSQIQHHPAFLQGTNVEFVHIHTPDCVEMRVWERGSGETLACGTGACAVFAALQTLSLCNKAVTVQLAGGVLSLTMEGAHIFMEGGATTVYEGEWNQC